VEFDIREEGFINRRILFVGYVLLKLPAAGLVSFCGQGKRVAHNIRYIIKKNLPPEGDRSRVIAIRERITSS